MFLNRTKLLIQTALLITCFFVVTGLKTGTKNVGVDHAVDYFKTSVAAFSVSAQELKTAVALLKDKDSLSILNARLALKNSRMNYKKIEFFMNYFFESSSLIYNKPAKVEVEEPYMEYQEPSGFQVMEALLFDDSPISNKESLTEQAELLYSSAADLNSLLYGFEANDKQLLESVRLELVRVITLSITGYDAPELKSGITESYQSVQAISAILEPFIQANPSASAKLQLNIKETLAYLKANPDFDSFNRMEFLTRYALPMQEQLRDFILQLNNDLNEKSVLNYSARNIFDPAALLPGSFSANDHQNPQPESSITMETTHVDGEKGKSMSPGPDHEANNMDKTGGSPEKKQHHAVLAVRNRERIALGKKLFLETALSGNLKRSCASCHHPDQYFAENLKTSLAFDGVGYVTRNAPSLIYSGFQYSQFWDGRAKNLPEQIRAVIANPQEMNGDHRVIISNLKKNKTYLAAFGKAYPAFTPQSAADKSSMAIQLNTENLADALAAYVMSLAPRNSPFDQYIAGDHLAMSADQVKGFNLFMGKGQCGSCHFAPLFNGLIPPLYKLTEYENLGTPANDDFNRPVKDKDSGRYGFFAISYYQAAFKTPTVRNVAMTAPYMHNGVFKDLEKVVQFYNLGGGAGLKLDLPQQTLSSKPLHLTDQEVKQIVVFMQSLTDKMN